MMVRKLFFFLTILPLLFIAPSIGAQGENSKKVEISNLKFGETINKNYFAVNERVEVSGTVNGDVYAAGGMILIDGRVNGDLLVAGGDVKISGEVTQDVRVVGGNVVISGKIGRNVTAFGGNIDVTDKGNIAGSVVVVGGNVTLSAPVGGGINAGAGNLTITNSVGGDVEAGVGEMRLTSKAAVAGNLTYWSEKEAAIDSAAVVTGKIEKKDSPRPAIDEKKIIGLLTAGALVVKLLVLASLFILGVLLVRFFPIFTENVVKNLRLTPLVSLGIGFLAVVLTPIIAVILLITLVGIPFGMSLLGLFAFILFFARIFAILLIGQIIMERSGRKIHQVWALLIGLAVYGVINIIPVLGSLASWLSLFFSVGAILITKRDTYLAARSKNII